MAKRQLIPLFYLILSFFCCNYVFCLYNGFMIKTKTHKTKGNTMILSNVRINSKGTRRFKFEGKTSTFIITAIFPNGENDLNSVNLIIKDSLNETNEYGKIKRINFTLSEAEKFVRSL